MWGADLPPPYTKGLLCSPESWPQTPETSHDIEYSILNDKCSIGIYVELKDTRWM